MRKARIQGTPARPNASAKKPHCRDCKGSEHVVRYMGRWVCNVHLKVKNERIKTGPLGELILPSTVETQFNLKPEWSFGELFVNRKHRRQAGHNRAFS